MRPRGWYDTGDIVQVDTDGFVSIKGWADSSHAIVSLSDVNAVSNSSSCESRGGDTSCAGDGARFLPSIVMLAAAERVAGRMTPAPIHS